MAHSSRFAFSLRVAITYSVAAALWIFLSDRLLSAFTADPHLLAWLQTYKGWAFVAFTALLLYWLVRREEIEQASLAAKTQTAYAQTEEMRQQLDRLIERISDGFVALDNDWRYTFVNAKAGELLGRRPKDLIGKHIWTEFPEGVDQPFYHAYHQAMAEQIPIKMEEYYPPWERWFENRIYPSMDGLCIFFHDITERKQTEEQLQHQLDMLQALYTGAHKLSESLDFSAIAQSVARLCVEVLGVQLAWLGRAETDGSISLLAQYPPEITYPRSISVRWDETPPGQGATGRAIREGAPVITLEIANDKHFSQWRDMALKEGLHSSAAFPLISRNKAFGTLNLYSPEPGFFNSERVALFQALAHQTAAALVNIQLYDEVRNYASELEQRVAERTADLESSHQELEAFSYSVSHDLRAPLRAMQGFAQALKEDFGDNLGATGLDYIQRIFASTRRMDTLIQDLLAYGQLTRVEIQRMPVSTSATVQEALAQLAGEIRQSGAKITVGSPLLDVMGHAPTLTQIISNLLGNAIKFVPPGHQPSIKVWSEGHGSKVRLWVEDNGIGIAPEYNSRIFRVFERLHGIETYPGTGIGLAIVHKGAQRMGGETGVESTPGKGSRFWVELDKPLEVKNS